MRESSIEGGLRKKLKRLGCLFYKFVSPGNNGVPDRIVITPSGEVIFVELKTTEGRLRPEQRIQLRRLAEHNAKTVVIYGKPDADDFVREIENTVRKEVRPDEVHPEGLPDPSDRPDH